MLQGWCAAEMLLRECLDGGGLALSRGLDLSRVYMEKVSPPIRAGSLNRVTRVNYIYFPTKPGMRYLRTRFRSITYT